MKTCPVCGKVFGPRYREWPAAFAQRERCGFYCRPPASPDKVGRARAEAMYPGEPCEVCGMPYGGVGRVQRHHKDSNRLNNTRENIAFLCAQHHKDAHRESDQKVGGGRRPRIYAMQREQANAKSRVARGLVASGLTVPEVAARLRVHPTSVFRWFRKYPAALP